ncbi:uncharacterized protein LOC141623584 [Silene latifolia]|uniref:uncharacterized protein LOC141623584 n=1 Tax=Silene latifolia TaxID=37657 RepID=UPI003D7833C7
MPQKRSTPTPSTMSQEEIDRLISMNEALTVALKAKGSVQDPAKMSASIARHNPTKYDGLGEPSLLGDWHREFDNLFELLGCPPEFQVDQAAYYLRGKAGLWWNRSKEVIREAWRESDESFITLKSFKENMRAVFVPEHIRSKMRAEFDSFKMTEEMTVETYYNRFMELSEYVADLNFSDEMLALRFEKGLTTTIKKRLAAGQPSTMDDVYQRAGHAERIADMLKEERREKEEKKEKSEKGKVEPSSENAGSKKQNSNQYYSYFANSAPMGGVSRGINGRSVANRDFVGSCFRCGKLGHKIIYCRVNLGKQGGGNGNGGYGSQNQRNYQTPVQSAGSNRNAGQWSTQRSYNNRQGNGGDKSNGGKTFGTAGTIQMIGEKGN